MVGNINKTNPICFYHGKIRSIRISKNQRYAADFEPGQTFGPKIPPFSSTRLSRLMAMPCETCRDISTTAGSSGSERHRFRIAPSQGRQYHLALRTASRYMSSAGVARQKP